MIKTAPRFISLSSKATLTLFHLEIKCPMQYIWEYITTYNIFKSEVFMISDDQLTFYHCADLAFIITSHLCSDNPLFNALFY